MSSTKDNGSPPPDSWAGKSRNAKAQARHRAKRKAYIEQLEQTVSKLQTALALSSEDVVNLPTTQMKLRELKDENDTLRAELRKLQMQSSVSSSSFTSNQDRVPVRTHSPVSSDSYPRPPKRRKASTAAVHEYFARNLRAYLGHEDVMIENPHLHQADSRQALHVPTSPPIPPPEAAVNLQRTVVHAADVPSVQHSRDSVFSWRLYPEDPLVDTQVMSWSVPSQSSHQRQRSCSAESNSSSVSDPLYLAQAHTPIQTSAAEPYEANTLHNNGVPYGHSPKPEAHFDHTDPMDAAVSYDLSPTIPLGDSTSQQNTWPSAAWPYSAVRMQ